MPSYRPSNFIASKILLVLINGCRCDGNNVEPVAVKIYIGLQYHYVYGNFDYVILRPPVPPFTNMD